MLAALTPTLPLSYMLFHNQIGKKNILLNCSSMQYLTFQGIPQIKVIMFHPHWIYSPGFIWRLKTYLLDLLCFKLCVRIIFLSITCPQNFFTLISLIPNKKLWKPFRPILNLHATDMGRNKGKAFQPESEPITDLEKKVSK